MEEKQPVAPQDGIGSFTVAAEPFKLLTVVSLPLLDHVDKVVGENEGDALSVDSKLGLEVPQKVAKINVEELTGTKWSP